jgi:lipopolysaccharide/colanic/teichoic acid biosynthesis glycosyltransferase
LKRLLDLAIALPLLVLFSLPALLVASILHRLWRCSPIFSQVRVGRNGQTFRMYKFRTLARDYPAESRKPSDRELAGHSPFCKWLRSSGLDELPQIWNVIRGDMSFVGPRPEMRFLVQQYDDRARRRLAVRPGITGLWQIAGDPQRPIHAQLKYDFYYLRRASLRLDAWICLRTLAIPFSGRGPGR